MEFTGEITGVFTQNGNSKKGAWTRYDVKCGETKFQTFDHALGQKAEKGATATITYHEEARGDFVNNVIDAIAVDAPSAPRNEKQRSKEEVRRTEAFKIAATLGADDLAQLTELGDAIANVLASTGQKAPEEKQF